MKLMSQPMPPPYPPQGTTPDSHARPWLPLWTGLAGIALGAIVGGSIVFGISSFSATQEQPNVAVDDDTKQEGADTPRQPATSTAADTHELGTEVSTDSDGSTATAYQVLELSDSDGAFVAIEVKVCVGHVPSGYEATVDTEFWGLRDADGRKYSAESSWGDHPEASPVLDPWTYVASDDCLRGWIHTDATSKDELETVQYLVPASEYGPQKTASWLVD